MTKWPPIKPQVDPVTARTPEDIRNELLVLRAQAGEEAALRELVELWHDKLKRHAWFQVHSVEAAADIVQEAWVAIFRGLRRLKDPSSFRAWAHQIVRRRAADWIRAETRRRKGQQLNEAVEPIELVAPANDERIEKLKRAMEQLPAELKQPVEMLYGKQLTISEIAIRLSLPEGTVKHRLYRARQKLRQHLSGGKENE